jgi:SNF2 family DNA or RNA helicase
VNPYAEIDPVDPKRIVVRVSFTQKDLIKQLPGSTWSHKDQAWKLPLGWSACITLRSVFGPELEIGPQLTEWARERYATRIGPSLALRDEVEREGDPSLFPFQRAGVAFLNVAERALLADEMGSGKTIQSIKALQQMHLSGKSVFPVLVVCPNSMKKTWEREAAKWWPGLTFLSVSGSAVQRRKTLETPAHGYIMNWESLRGHSRLAPYGSISLKRCKECGGEDQRVSATQCHVHPRELQQLKFQTVIADEVHRAKDPKSQQTRALWAATGDAPYRFALTGTPIANAPDDLWPIMHWLDAAQFPSRTRWIDRFCEVMYNAFGSPTVIGIKPEREQEFQSIVNPMMRRMPKSLVLPFLPPIVRERREVEMSPKQAKAYKQMSEQMIAELENGDVLLAASPLVKATRLIQFSSAFAELETKTDALGNPEVQVHLSDPSCKIDAFMDDLADYEGKSVVVFAQSRQLIDLLSDRLSKQKKPIPHGLITGGQTGEERQDHMDDFQSGKTKLILCTIQAGGTGITLTQGSIAVFLQRSWSLVDTKQAEARIHRIGSEMHESVEIIDYVTTGTIEEYQIAAISQKGDRLEAIVRDADLLKRVLLKQNIDADAEVDAA